MRRPPITQLLLGLLVLPACPGNDDGNPRTLYLALDGTETRVRLAEAEPDPF